MRREGFPKWKGPRAQRFALVCGEGELILERRNQEGQHAKAVKRRLLESGEGGRERIPDTQEKA